CLFGCGDRICLLAHLPACRSRYVSQRDTATSPSLINVAFHDETVQRQPTWLKMKRHPARNQVPLFIWLRGQDLPTCASSRSRRRQRRRRLARSPRRSRPESTGSTGSWVEGAELPSRQRSAPTYQKPQR